MMIIEDYERAIGTPDHLGIGRYLSESEKEGHRRGRKARRLLPPEGLGGSESLSLADPTTEPARH